jgi:hypothetical protein
MATTTTNYGFDIPQSTDLVKDGATAIATLGQDIDTAMNTALGTKKAGMVLLNTTSFSAVATQSINSVFSATYDNYRIVVNTSASATTSGQIRMNLRASGADLALNEYRNGGLLMRSTAANANFNANGVDQWRLTESLITNGTIGLSIDIISPFLSQLTKMNYVTSGQDASSIIGVVGGGIYGDNASADGIKLAVTAGTITGTISVYGYNK